MKISKVFRRLYNKVWNPLDFQSLQLDVSISLRLVEMHFPPSFFDIMTHFMYYLVDELHMCGPVVIKWMYPIERYMKTLKLYVRNMARSKAQWLRDTYKMNVWDSLLNTCKCLM
jgi:hypothetical protein